MSQVASDEQLIRNLGGPTKVARLTGLSVQRVHNWLRRGIPAHIKVLHPELFMPHIVGTKDAKQPKVKPVNKDASTIVERLGGTTATAKLFGLRAPSITDWKEYGIPRSRMMYLEVARPDVLSEIDTESATAVGRARKEECV